MPVIQPTQVDPFAFSLLKGRALVMRDPEVDERMREKAELAEDTIDIDPRG